MAVYITVTTIDRVVEVRPTISEISQSLLLHPVSSLPSVQSCVPSQRSEERIHWPLVHRNAPLEQKTVTVVSMARGVGIGKWEERSFVL